MRILISTQYPYTAGGTETYLRGLIPQLVTRGHAVALVTAVGPDPTRPPLAPDVTSNSCFFGRSAAHVVDQLRTWRPDVVFAHGMADPDLDQAIAAVFSSVYFAHNYAGGCISGTKTHAFPTPTACTRPLGPGCLGLYLPRRCGGLNPVSMVRLYRRERHRQELFRSARFVAVASRHMAAEVVRGGTPEGRVRLVPLFPPGVNPDTDPPVAKPRTDRVLFVGRLSALKGWRQLLDALPVAGAKLGRSLTLVVAGDGPDRGAAEAEARRRGISAEFLGWVGADRREVEMRRADVLAFPSIWPEPFGLAGIEAGCVGLPAVGFAVGGVPDWLTPGVSGESAPGARPDPGDLADAFVRALADEAHWNRLRLGAWETARRFSPEAHLDRLIPLLEAAARS